MMAGHFAVALAARPQTPRVSLGWLVAAAFGLDLLWPLLLLSGVEFVAIDPGNTAFTPLRFDHYPWSHSLLLTCVWALLVFVAARRSFDARAAAWLGALVISHWFLDLITHRPDLPLWPEGPVVGLGLWNSVAGTYLLEGALFAACLAWYLRSKQFRSRGAAIAFGGLVVTVIVIWAAGPFSPPPSVAAVAGAGIGLWLFPVWAWWADKR